MRGQSRVNRRRNPFGLKSITSPNGAGYKHHSAFSILQFERISHYPRVGSAIGDIGFLLQVMDAAR